MDKKKIISICQVAIGVLAFIMIFLNCLVDDVPYANSEFAGYEIIFATKDGLDISIVGIIFVLVLVAIIVLGIMKLLGKGKALVVNVAILICSVVAAIIFFCFNTSLMVNLENGSWDGDYYKLGIGAIIGAILCIANAALTAVDQFAIK